MKQLLSSIISVGIASVFSSALIANPILPNPQDTEFQLKDVMVSYENSIVPTTSSYVAQAKSEGCYVLKNGDVWKTIPSMVGNFKKVKTLRRGELKFFSDAIRDLKSELGNHGVYSISSVATLPPVAFKETKQWLIGTKQTLSTSSMPYMGDLATSLFAPTTPEYKLRYVVVKSFNKGVQQTTTRVLKSSLSSDIVTNINNACR